MTTCLLHSVSYAGLWGQAFLPVDDFIDKASELGYDGVMLMAKRPHVSILDYGPQDRARLRSQLDKRKLTNLCLAGYCNLTADLEHADIPQREIQIQYIVELARLARDLGGSLVRVFTGYNNPAATYGAQWKLVIDTLREASQRVADFGVTLGVQNHHDISAGSDTMHDLITAIDQPNCRALFDAWAPALHGEDLQRVATLMAPMTAHTTVADYQLRPRYRYEPQFVNYQAEKPYVQAVPMGQGFIDYGTFLNAMYAAGFQGSVAYEMCSPLLHGGELKTLDRYAQTFLDYMRTLQGSNVEVGRETSA